MITGIRTIAIQVPACAIASTMKMGENLKFFLALVALLASAVSAISRAYAAATSLRLFYTLCCVKRANVNVC